jgi:hypothetical protein
MVRSRPERVANETSATSWRVLLLPLPTYADVLARQKSHGRVDKAVGICQQCEFHFLVRSDNHPARPVNIGMRDRRSILRHHAHLPADQHRTIRALAEQEPLCSSVEEFGGAKSLLLLIHRFSATAATFVGRSNAQISRRLRAKQLPVVA